MKYILALIVTVVFLVFLASSIDGIIDKHTYTRCLMSADLITDTDISERIQYCELLSGYQELNQKGSYQ